MSLVFIKIKFSKQKNGKIRFNGAKSAHSTSPWILGALFTLPSSTFRPSPHSSIFCPFVTFLSKNPKINMAARANG